MNRRAYRSLTTGTLGFAALFSLQQASAQEALTASRGAYQSATARSQAAQGGGYAHESQTLKYNLSAGIAFEYDDNVNLSQNNAEDDFSIKPRVSAGMDWAITDYSKLGFDISLGYSYYVNDSDRSGLDFSLSPTADNNIGFQMLLGNWQIHVYDSFGVRSDPVRDATASNTDEIVQFDNTLGAIAYYDLGTSRLNAGYAFKTSLFQDSQYSDSERNSHMFHAGYEHSFNPAVTVGIESSASMSVYRSGRQNDNTVYTVGPTLQWLPTDFITVSAGGGPALVTYKENDLGYQPEDRESYYLYAMVNHRFNEFASHTLSVNQSVSPATQSSSSQTLSFSYRLTLDIIRATTLTFGVFYETGEAQSGIGALNNNQQFRQEFDRIGARASISRTFGERISSSLSYAFVHRNSDTVNGDYDQNRVTLSFNYKF